MPRRQRRRGDGRTTHAGNGGEGVSRGIRDWMRRSEGAHRRGRARRGGEPGGGGARHGGGGGRWPGGNPTLQRVAGTESGAFVASTARENGRVLDFDFGKLLTYILKNCMNFPIF